MGGSGGGTTTSYVKQDTSNLPSYAQPYYQQLMEGAQGDTLGQTYTPYQGQRIADFTPAQQWSMNNQMNMQVPGQYNTGSQLATAAGLGALQATGYQPGQFQAAQVNPTQVQNYQTGYGSQPLNQYQMQGPQQWNQQTAQQYMSPYTQSAIDVTQQQAIRNAQESQLAQNLGQARQGTYGGSRSVLDAAENQRNLNTNLSNIEATGLNQAYANAQQQFNTAQQQQQAANAQNLQAQLGVQQLGTNTGLQAALANLQSMNTAQGLQAQQNLAAQQSNQQYGMQAQQLGEQSRQFGAQNQLAALAQAGQMGQTLGNLGQSQYQTEQGLQNAQMQTATLDQALQQQALDQQYQDFLTQQQYPLQMLQQYSSLLRGVPVTPQTTATVSSPTPSLASQILGTGLGAAGMYKTLSS